MRIPDFKKDSLKLEKLKPIPGKTTEIIGDRWDKPFFPYSFYVGEASGPGSVSKVSSPDPMSISEVVLNLPPQALSVQVQFASSVAATNRGVLEENNGVVFRTINITGTTGIYPNRPTSGRPAPSRWKDIANAVAPAFTTALSKAVKDWKNTIGDKTPPNKANNKMTDKELQGTGYYQFWLLHNFFIEYAEMKKKGYSNRRLVFACPKDNIAYICTPLAFDLRRDSANPMLYRYSISLRAWDIVSYTATNFNLLDDDIPNRKSILSVKKVLDRIRRARNAIQSSANVIRGFQSDIFSIMDGVNQGVLAIKDVAGVGVQLMDVLPTIKSNANLLVVTNKNQWAQLINENRAVYEKSKKPYGALEDLQKNISGVTGKTSGSDVSSQLSAKGVSAGSSSFNTSPTGESSSQENSNSSNISAIAPFLDNPDLADSVSLRDLGTLPESVQKEVNSAVQSSTETNAGDVRSLVSKLSETSDNLAYSSGMMDANYAATFGLPIPDVNDSTREPTEDDILLAASIEEAKDAFLSTLAVGDIFPEKQQDPFASANDYVPDTEQFQTPTSSYVVTVQRGMTIEKMAQVYLGDASRSREIAMLNNLRAPYIDEEGFSVSISLATGRSFLVRDRSKLAVSQYVYIGGNLVPETRRKILAIEDVGNGNFRVVVNGTPNLDKYISLSNPYVRGRQPGTVGTGDNILIPSDQAPDQVDDSRPTSLTDRLTFAEKIFRVDVGLAPNGDLDVGSSGDVSRSYGYANAVQAIRVLLETEVGELEWHPQYGLGAIIGERTSDDILATIEDKVKSSIVSDPRFSDADVSAAIEGTEIRIRIEANGAQGTGRIPVEFTVPINA